MANEVKFTETELKDGTKAVWRVLKTTPTEGPYLFVQHKNHYDIQNKLHSGFNFPKYIYKLDKKSNKNLQQVVSEDEIFSVYIDRLDYEVSSKIFKMINDAPLNVNEFKEVAKFVYDKEVSGARCVRFTNVSSGYPTYRFDFVTKGKDTPNWERENPYKEFYRGNSEIDPTR